MANDENAPRYGLNRISIAKLKRKHINLFLKINKKDLLEKNNFAFKQAKRKAKEK